MRTVAASLVMAASLLAGCTQHHGGIDVELPSEEPPPPWGAPITGGTLTITRDGTHAVIGDPDRDRVVLFDLVSETEIESIALTPGSSPGRAIEDGAGRLHVALRGGGELLTLTATPASSDSATPSSWSPAHRKVCSEPRGLAWDAASDLVHVACATGELVSVPAATGAAVRTVHLERDLRDVIVREAGLVVTTFRTAEVLTLDASGAIIGRAQPPITQRFEATPPCVAPPCIFADDGLVDALPTVAWRTIAIPDGRLLMSHQRKLDGELKIASGGYHGGCGGGPVESAMSVFSADEPPLAVAPILFGALPVDVAAAPNGGSVSFVVAGRKTVHVVPTRMLVLPDENNCGGHDASAVRVIDDELGAPTSVAYAPNGDLYIYYPELPALVTHGAGGVRTLRLSGDIGYDSGRALFHEQTGVGIACASCHPEGREDGQIWTFEELGPRRTQSLAGGILERGPYHWAGDMADLPTLMQDVFTSRMLGGEVSRSQRLSLGPWLDRVPAPAGVTVDRGQVDRGRALFESEDTQCANCHAGDLRTNNMRVDVGTGGMFKVPSLLGVGARAPFLHDGCAPTLRDRFGAVDGLCGGGDKHGHTSQLTAPQLADLIAYLESL